MIEVLYAVAYVVMLAIGQRLTRRTKRDLYGGLAAVGIGILWIGILIGAIGLLFLNPPQRDYLFFVGAGLLGVGYWLPW